MGCEELAREGDVGKVAAVSVDSFVQDQRGA